MTNHEEQRYAITVSVPIKTEHQMHMSVYARTMVEAQGIALREAQRLTENNAGWWAENTERRTIAGKMKAERTKA